MNRIRILFLNGPPGSGKDSIAQTLEGISINNPELGILSVPYKMSRLLKLQVLHDFGFYPVEYWYDFFEDRKNKEEIREDLGGISFRAAVIHKSEKEIKPRFGKDFYGRYLAKQMRYDAQHRTDLDHRLIVHTISDSGFYDEAIPVVNEFGMDKCRLIRIHAEHFGSSYEGDSRSYVTLPIETIDFNNNKCYEQPLMSNPEWQERCLEFIANW